MSEWRERVNNWTDFNFWQQMGHNAEGVWRFLVRTVLVAWLSVREFSRDRCGLRASALTFYTLLSIVPVAAMAFGIAQGFGFEKRLETELYKRLVGQEQVVEQIIAFAKALLENSKGGMLAGIGILMLFWSTIKVLNHIEISFNDIWRVKTARSWVRKFSDYLSIILISPVLILVSSSTTVFVTTQISLLADRWHLSAWSEPLVLLLLQSSPYVLFWILFTMIYLIMPNTRVRWLPALVAGILAGTCYHFLQWGYISFQIGAAKLSAIYGSFAALPLFLLWLQLSWMIVMLGAEVAFVLEHYRDLTMINGRFKDLSHYHQRVIYLAVSRLVVSRFVQGEAAPNTDGIAEHLGLPKRLVRSALERLMAAKVLTATADPAEPAYVPARSPDQITVGWVSHQLDRVGAEWLPSVNQPEMENIKSCVDLLTQQISTAPANRPLMNL